MYREKKEREKCLREDFEDSRKERRDSFMGERFKDGPRHRSVDHKSRKASNRVQER